MPGQTIYIKFEHTFANGVIGEPSIDIDCFNCAKETDINPIE